MHPRFILASAVFAFTAAFTPMAFAGEDNEPHATGCRPPTAEEAASYRARATRVDKIRMNELARQRVNAHRRAKGLAEIAPGSVAPMGEEMVSATGTSSDTGTTTLDAQANVGALPVAVNNTQLKYFPPVGNQGSQGSCACFSSTYYQMTHMTGLARDFDNKTDGTHRFSPAWTYNMINGGSDSGSYPTGAHQFMMDAGCATWNEFPYSTATSPSTNYTKWSLDGNVWRNAINYRLNAMGTTSAVDTDAGMSQLKQMLVNGYVVTFATNVYGWQFKTIPNNTAGTADDPYVGGKIVNYCKAGQGGGHAMTVAGYNDEIWCDVNGNGTLDAGELGALLIVNSWGTGWSNGNGGMCWLAYDALKATSAVAGAPTDREATFWSNEVYWITAKPSYTPTMVGMFTVNHAKRNQMRLQVGKSDTTKTVPTSVWGTSNYGLYNDGGALAFDGTTTACDGTFCLDMTNLAPNTGVNTRYYVGMTDDGSGAETGTIKSFNIIDVAGGNVVKYAANVPQTANANTVYAYTDYSASGLPVVSVAASVPNASEAGPTAGKFTLSRTGATTAALAVTVSMGGTATNGSDYATLSTSYTIPAGAASLDITVTPINDTAVEPTETVIMTVVVGAAYNIGTGSATVSIASDDSYANGPGTGITREWWTGIAGTAVTDLTGNAAYPNSPTGSAVVTTLFEAPTDWADSYGTRMHGYFIPPATGAYTFYIASDDSSELWLSTTANPANVVKIAYLSGWCASRNWTANASQQSAPINLVAGNQYYIMALQKEGSGGDNLAVGVDLPGGISERPIPYHRLNPYVVPAPTVSAVSPSSGSTLGGTGVTITGTNLTGATAVKFGATSATGVTVVSATQVTCTSPSGSAGVVDVTVTTAGGTSATGTADRFTYVVPAPTVSAVTPSSGSTLGGTVVTITGTNLTGATAVKFGATSATGVTVVSATQVTCTSPSGSAGVVDVTVTTAGGTSATGTADRFTYVVPAPTVSAVTPSSGSTLGGTVVTITGTNLTGATAVKFGATSATGVTVVSATQVTCTSPSGSAGVVDVTVTTAGGTSATGTADRFTYVVPAPTVSSVTPSSGSTLGGTVVTITGTNLTGATAVKFGATSATGVTVVSATQITCTSPAGSAGVVDVTVTTAGGTSATGTADRFTYVVPAPTVSAVTPSSGSTLGGTAVTITGTNLTGATAVKFGTTSATGVTVVSATQATCTSPAGSAGVVDVTVTTPGGTSAIGTADRFTYVAPNVAPVIDSLPWASPNPVEFPGTTAVHVLAHDPDSGPSPLSYTWSKDSGPGTVTFVPNGTAAAQDSVATFSAAGAYVLRVTVSDGNKTDTDTVFVTVNAATPPSAISLSASLVSMFTKFGVAGASAIGEYSASFVAGNGVDGVTSTDWNGPFRSVVQEEWYRVDLGVVKSVGKVRILPRGDYPLLMPGSFVLEGSVDGVSYTTMKVESGYVGQSGVWYEGTFSAANVRYVRLRGNTVSAYGVKSMGFAEFEVWGPQGQGVQLSWTAPGDNGAVGTATSYEVRYSISGVISDETAWSAATAISGAPIPSVAGTAQSMTIPASALPGEATLYFGLRAVDAVGNRGGLSNSPSVVMPGIAPAAVSNLSVSNPTANGFTVSFTAVGDDGNVGAATTYDVRCSTSPLTELNWAVATVLTGEPAPKVAGLSEIFAVSGAQEDTTYYVGIKVADEMGNWSGLSNVVSIKTADVTAPSAVGNLSVGVVTLGTLVKFGVVGASATGEYSASFVAGNGVDGVMSTDWNGPFRSVVQEEWYRVDLGIVKSVGKVRILPRGSYPLLMPGSFVLEGSVDGVSYTTMKVESGYVGQSGVWYEGTFSAANVRYVRLRGNTVSAYGVKSMGFAEFEVWGLDPKLSIVGASATGEYSASFVAGNGVDGVTSTDWNGPFRSVVQEEWYRVDLGIVKSVGKVRILPRGSYPLLMPGSFVLEGSVDGVSYTTMKVESGYVGQSGVWYEGTFSAANVRYVRLRGNTVSAYGVKSMGFAEFEVWGSQGQGVQLSWTAPGDNGALGTATSYEVRYSTSGAITSGNWASATAVSSTYVPTPLVAGTAQSMTVPLTALGSPATGTVIYFSVRAKDEANNQGGVSNAVSVTAP